MDLCHRQRQGRDSDWLHRTRPESLLPTARDFHECCLPGPPVLPEPCQPTPEAGSSLCLYQLASLVQVEMRIFKERERDMTLHQRKLCASPVLSRYAAAWQ